jgi:hypothetical protein
MVAGQDFFFGPARGVELGRTAPTTPAANPSRALYNVGMAYALRLAVLVAFWNCVDYPYGLWLFLLAAWAVGKCTHPFKVNPGSVAHPPHPSAENRCINPRHVKCAAKLFIFKAP